MERARERIKSGRVWTGAGWLHYVACPHGVAGVEYYGEGPPPEAELALRQPLVSLHVATIPCSCLDHVRQAAQVAGRN